MVDQRAERKLGNRFVQRTYQHFVISALDACTARRDKIQKRPFRASFLDFTMSFKRHYGNHTLVPSFRVRSVGSIWDADTPVVWGASWCGRCGDRGGDGDGRDDHGGIAGVVCAENASRPDDSCIGYSSVAYARRRIEKTAGGVDWVSAN